MYQREQWLVRCHLWLKVVFVWIVSLVVALCFCRPLVSASVQQWSASWHLFHLLMLAAAWYVSYKLLRSLVYSLIGRVAGGIENPAKPDDVWEKQLLELFGGVCRRSALKFKPSLNIHYSRDFNAFARGSEVSINSAMIWISFKDREYEGLMGHEVGHIFLGSGRLRRLTVQVLAFCLGLVLVNGVFDAHNLPAIIFAWLWLQYVAVAVTMFVYRMDERATDTMGVLVNGHAGLADFFKRLCRHGYCSTVEMPETDPGTLSRLWGQHHAQHGEKPSVIRHFFEGLLRTHDFTSARIEHVERVAAKYLEEKVDRKQEPDMVPA